MRVNIDRRPDPRRRDTETERASRKCRHGGREDSRGREEDVGVNCRCSTRSLRQAETVSVGGLLGEDDEEEIQHLSACSKSSVVQLNALSNVVFRSTANEGRSKGRQDREIYEVQSVGVVREA